MVKYMVNIFGLKEFDQDYTLTGFLDQSAFDEKFEIDLENDLTRNIYHVNNKYYIPNMNGSFSDLARYANEYILSDLPEDFVVKTNYRNLKNSLAESETKGILKYECKMRLVDGSYRWVHFFFVNGKENGVPDQIIYLYIFDIQNQKDRINGIIPMENYISNRDSKTGLLLRSQFVSESKKLIERQKGSWCCVAIDIQHFKVFNSWFGKEKGNYVLARIGSVLREYELNDEAIASYFERDNFGIVIRHDKKVINQLFESIKEIIYSYSNTIGFIPAFGIYVIDPNENITMDIYDKARIAVEDAKAGYSERIKYYDSKSFNLKKEHYQLLTEFQSALNNGEISFYVQPQCNISNGKIIGGEALVRWIKKDGTNISPGKFIPVLEEDGFITDLDKCIWESVCKWIRCLMNQGLTPLPISINVSQIDIVSLDVASYLYGLIQRYNIPSRYLKVEITESAFASDFNKISKTVANLKEKGFVVYLDDFGSGYSSLNMLDKINTDVLKLDMAFINKDTSLSVKGVSIIESIISMTKTLNIPVIIEGVETEEQMTFLKNLGCIYAQGYYFYRPMPIQDFEEILKNKEKIDISGIKNRSTELFRTREFLDENTFPDAVLNNILGPVAFYIQDKNGGLNITRFNQPFYECISDVNMEGRTSTIQNYIVEEDRARLKNMLEKAYEDPINGGECTVRFYKSGGGVFWFNMHLYFLQENDQGRVFYGKIADSTKMYQQAYSFYENLKANAFSVMRIDLTNNLIYELGKNRPFDDPTARAMDVDECLRKTADTHIPDEKEREEFVQFFSPKKLRKSHESGVYNETLSVSFYMGKNLIRSKFSAYYIKFTPDQSDNVYTFVYPE